MKRYFGSAPFRVRGRLRGGQPVFAIYMTTPIVGFIAARHELLELAALHVKVCGLWAADRLWERPAIGRSAAHES